MYGIECFIQGDVPDLIYLIGYESNLQTLFFELGFRFSATYSVISRSILFSSLYMACFAFMDVHLVVAIALVVGEWTYRAVDWNLVEVRPAETDQLGVRIGEKSALQQWIHLADDLYRHFLFSSGI